MQDPKFEKQVQQKMEELSFSPSDAVWLKVDSEINRTRKRRGAFIWLFMLAGIFTAASLYFVSTTGKSRLADKIHSPSILPKEKNTADNSSYEKPATSGSVAFIRPGHSSQQPVTSHSEKYNSGKALTGKYILSNEKSEILTQPHGGTGPRAYENNTSNLPSTTAAETNNSFLPPPVMETNKIAEGKKDPDVIKPIQPDSTNETKKLPTAIQAVMKSEKKKNNTKWSLGFTAGAGMSSVKQSLFKNSHVGNDDRLPAPSSGTVTGPVIYHPSSEIQSSFSFQAGFFLKKSLTKKLSFSAGLNYHLYAARVTTGAISDSVIYVAYNNAVAIPVSSTYRSGTAAIHTSHYHFLEMPLTIGLPFYNSRRLSLTWETGGSVSYLLYADALQFDNFTGLYYKNNAAFNRVQVNAATAVLAGFPGSRIDWQVGPQIEYGVTGLLDKNLAHPEHLLYLGLKFSVIFGKK